MMRILLFPILVCLLLAGCSASGQEIQVKSAPDFTLNTPEREEITLQHYKGKPLVITFWTSWCPECKEEMPVLQKIQDQYGDKIAILGINLTYQDDRKEITKFLTEKEIRFDIVLDKFGEVADLYQVQALPALFFIDSEGKMIKQSAGALSEEKLLEEIESLINKS